MNSNLDDIAEQFGANPGWPLPQIPLPLPAVLSYFANKGKPRMTEPTKSNADIITAGVHSCLLALDTITELERFDDPKPQAMVKAARSVLSHWGLEIKPGTPAPPASEAEAAPDEIPGVGGPVAAAPLPADHLLWPPPEPTLPAVYTENYYLPREAFEAWAAHDGPGGLPLAVATVAVNSFDRFIFKGTSYWTETHGCWFMRMEMLTGLSTTAPRPVWVLSKHVKPGDDLPPEIIDSATLAGNNDP